MPLCPRIPVRTVFSSFRSVRASSEFTLVLINKRLIPGHLSPHSKPDQFSASIHIRHRRIFFVMGSSISSTLIPQMEPVIRSDRFNLLHPALRSSSAPMTPAARDWNRLCRKETDTSVPTRHGRFPGIYHSYPFPSDTWYR